ncbi:MAG: isoaspartyl peptidase/L-asparaginase, partial [Bifidobacterium sp.]|nr:isoaspartyl peptidase/L-asparaginase [Bifidobacterium sp.]
MSQTTSTPHVVREFAGSEDGILLVIHAGAGNRGKHDSPERRAQAEQDLRRALEAGYTLLEQGAPAQDAVCAAIRVMEDAPEFNAGRGAALTSTGLAQMDACLMTDDGEVGAVAGVTTARNPIDAARAVKEQTKHVLFAVPDTAQLESWGVATCEPDY